MRRASETFKLAADALHQQHPGEPLFDRLETALRAASILSAGDEYRAMRTEQETMTHCPVAYPPLIDALLPVAEGSRAVRVRPAVVTAIPREGETPPEPRWSVDECWDHYPNHPTIFVRTCSPDPLLTHDGETSQACRTCGCGRAGSHVTGCTAGHGPPRKATTEETACLQVDGLCDLLVTKYGVPAEAFAAVREWNRDRWPWPEVSIPDFRAGDRPLIPSRPDLVNSS